MAGHIKHGGTVQDNILKAIKRASKALGRDSVTFDEINEFMDGSANRNTVESMATRDVITRTKSSGYPRRSYFSIPKPIEKNKWLTKAWTLEALTE